MSIVDQIWQRTIPLQRLAGRPLDVVNADVCRVLLDQVVRRHKVQRLHRSAVSLTAATAPAPALRPFCSIAQS